MYKRTGEMFLRRFAWGFVSMVLPKSADRQSLLESRFERRRFTRRADLTNSIRLTIAADALHAMLSGVWGTITNLADEYVLRLISFKGEPGKNSHAIPGHSIKLNLDVIGTNTTGVRKSSWQTSAFWLRRVKEES